MEDILANKSNLPADFIDVSVGEPHLVRDNLIRIFDLDTKLNSVDTNLQGMSYPHPIGYQPLVKYLEKKYGYPVVITNGAKQALGATFYALSKMGKLFLGMRKPYWALIPPLASMHALTCTYNYANFRQAELCLAPNNPDGYMPDLVKEHMSCRSEGIPFIHDAAYYTHIYLPRDVNLEVVGDVQIYSISKMLGLSGLRLGYVVCPNKEFYQLIRQYMEAMTVGVSLTSQQILYKLMVEIMEPQPNLVREFEDTCFGLLQENKNLCLQINPEILQVQSNITSIPGMFGWFKVGEKANFKKSRVNVIGGELFGEPGFVRMNLAFGKDTMQEIVDRINLLK